MEETRPMTTISSAAALVLETFTANRGDEFSNQGKNRLAAALREASAMSPEVPVYVMGDTYWPYVNGIEAMQDFLYRLADELEAQR